MIEIALVLSILVAAMVLLVSEWIPMEVTALLVLGAVARTRLVPRHRSCPVQQPGSDALHELKSPPQAHPRTLNSNR